MFQPTWWPNFSLFGSRISAYLAAKFQPIWWQNFSLYDGKISAYMVAEFQPIWLNLVGELKICLSVLRF